MNDPKRSAAVEEAGFEVVPCDESNDARELFPLTTIKIDKSFTGGIASDPKDAAITKALLAMAHRLDLNVVAEGVENEDQFSFLGENECDEVQGYLFGRPIPANELFRVLTSR